jgi:hypothetical protein
MADQSFDAGRVAGEQQSRIAASAAIALNAFKPMMLFQVSLLRLWADSIEALAKDYEKGLVKTSPAVEHQAQQQRAA